MSENTVDQEVESRYYSPAFNPEQEEKRQQGLLSDDEILSGLSEDDLGDFGIESDADVIDSYASEYMEVEDNSW